MILDNKARKKRTRGNLGSWKGGGYSSTRRRDIQDITFGNGTKNWISGGGNWNYRTKRRYKTTSFYVNWDYNIVVKEIDV